MDTALLDLREAELAWEAVTAGSQILHARGGHTSLHDRYRADEDPEAPARKLEELTTRESDAEAEPLAQVLREAAGLSLTGGLESEETK